MGTDAECALVISIIRSLAGKDVQVQTHSEERSTTVLVGSGEELENSR